MDPKGYLTKHHLTTYIDDLTAIIIENRPSKVSTGVQPINTVLDYFHKVLTGAHVYSREYGYISSTPYNRACFIRMIWQCYYKLNSERRCMKCSEYFQLIQILCDSFKCKFTDKMDTLFSRILATSEPKVSFSDFLYTFEILFFYEDFLQDCQRIFERHNGTLSEQHTGPVKSVVILPRFESETEMVKENAFPVSVSPVVSGEADVDLCSSVISLCTNIRKKQLDKVAPSLGVVQEALAHFESREKSFDDFLISLCGCEQVVLDIGVLPPKAVFIDTLPPDIGTPVKLSY